MSFSYDAVIKQSSKYLDFIAKEELTKEEKDWVVRESGQCKPWISGV